MDKSIVIEAIEESGKCLAILSGDIVGPSDSSWQDIAGDCATYLKIVSAYLNASKIGGDTTAIPVLLDSLLRGANREKSC